MPIIKTEPVQVALFGLIFLGDKITPLAAAAILIATAGVIVMSLKPGAGQIEHQALDRHRAPVRRAVRVVGDRLSRRHPVAGPADFVLAATFTVAVGLVIQAALLTLYLVLREPKVLHAIVHAWRPSLFAGFMGAFASEFWFLGFAITTAANVRTLALVEVLFAQGVTQFIFKQPTTEREVAGIVLVVIGVALLVWAY